jgi:hypothetical protein
VVDRFVINNKKPKNTKKAEKKNVFIYVIIKIKTQFSSPYHGHCWSPRFLSLTKFCSYYFIHHIYIGDGDLAYKDKDCHPNIDGTKKIHFM